MFNPINNVGYSGKVFTNYNQPKNQQAKTEVEKDADANTDKLSFSDIAVESSAKTVKMSSAAENYLNTLKEKYGDMDFVIADYETDEQASELLSQGEGSINVLITPDVLEKMATDDSAREYYEGIISGAQNTINDMSEALGDEAQKIDAFGFTVNADGEVNYFAKLKDGYSGEDGSKKISATLVEDLIANIKKANEKQDARDELREKIDNAPSLPPESFKKFEKDSESSAEEDYGTLPPESFKKYEKEDSPYTKDDDYGNLPPESFQKFTRDKNINKQIDFTA